MRDAAAWRGLALLTAVNVLSFSDRGLIMLLLEPIQHDLRLSDTALGFVGGVAFGLFYAVLGLPLARWADRGDRIGIAALAMALWGATVMSTLFIGNFVQLVLARVAAGVGEAGCFPPTYSLVGDYFAAPRLRNRAMGVFMLASPIAGVLSFAIGGWANSLWGWRAAFFVLGPPALLLAILLRLTLRDPRCREAAPPRPPARLGEVLAELWRNRSMRWLGAAFVLAYATGQGLAPWYGVFMIRDHGLRPEEVGQWFALIFGSAGVGGILLGGWMTPDSRMQLRLLAALMLLSVPCSAVFLFARSPEMALGAMGLLVMVLSVLLAPTFTLLQRLVEEGMRASSVAAVMLIANVAGMGLGPQVVGIMSDLLRPLASGDALRWAMLGISSLGLGAAACYLRASRSIDADLAKVPS